MNMREGISEATQELVSMLVNSREWTSEPAWRKVRKAVNRVFRALW